VIAVSVGNDVVDIARPRTIGRSKDDRFLRRILDEEEQETVRAAEDPDVELWARWAAKEAAFKVVGKLAGEAVPFALSAFKVVWDATVGPTSEESSSVIRDGSVLRGGFSSRVSVTLRDGGLHAVAADRLNPAHPVGEIYSRAAFLDERGRPWSGPLESLVRRLSEKERVGVRSLASVAVRVGARAHLADILGVPESRLEIVRDAAPAGRAPPRVLLDGEEADMSVSLSHDGRWIAWALSVGSTRSGT